MWLQSSSSIEAVAAISLCLSVGTSPALADIINIPGDAATIQGGIDLAVNGDEVVVADGVYTGDGNRDLDFGGKLITVRSENGPDDCIIDCQGTQEDNHRGFYFHSGETKDAIVQGFTITNGFVTSNGGGMYIDNSSPMVRNCIFNSNFTHQLGGGIFNNNSSPTVSNCTFDGNTAESGGGMGTWFGSNPMIENCQFLNNQVELFGGGLDCFNNSNPTLTDCLISGNEAQFGAGAVVSAGSEPTFTTCAITNNTANGLGGGMYIVSGASPTLTGCTFSGNMARDDGGGMYDNNSSPTVSNCILWGDSPNEIDGPATVSHSDVAGGFTGTGNIDVDPMFVDPDNGDWHLSPESLCIDAADNTAVPKGVVTDLDGNPRFIEDPNTPDTGLGDCPIVDMGSYEFEGTCPLDLDCSGSVGLGDLLLVLAHWDNPYRLSDLLALLANWGPCP